MSDSTLTAAILSTSTAVTSGDTVVTFLSGSFDLETLRQMLSAYFSFESMVSGHSCYGLATVGIRFNGMWEMADAVARCEAVSRQILAGMAGLSPELLASALSVMAFDIGSELVEDHRDMEDSVDYDPPSYDEEYEIRIHGEYEVIKAQYGAEAADIYLYGIDYRDEWRERDQRVRDERDDAAETEEEALERRALCVR